MLAEHLALTPSSPHAPQYPSSGRSPDVDTSAKPWVGVKQSPEACEVQLCWVPLQASYKASFKGTYMVWGSVKPTITGRRFNGSPSHGKRLACLHLPHPDDFVMEGLHQPTTADCNEPPVSLHGLCGDGHVCIGNGITTVRFLAHLMPLPQISGWIPRRCLQYVARQLPGRGKE